MPRHVVAVVPWKDKLVAVCSDGAVFTSAADGQWVEDTPIPISRGESDSGWFSEYPPPPHPAMTDHEFQEQMERLQRTTRSQDLMEALIEIARLPEGEQKARLLEIARSLLAKP